MPALVLFSRRQRAGKTAVAVGLAQRLRRDKRPVALIRIGAAGDESAVADARCFSALGLAAGGASEPLSNDDAAGVMKAAPETTYLLELPAGQDASPSEAAVIMVGRFADLGTDTAPPSKTPGSSWTGLIVTATPASRIATIGAEAAGRGVHLLAVLPEDRLLAAPTIAEMADALEAQALFLDGRAETLVERITIASIAADPGQGYFVQFGPQAVVVRCDKPDLHLAALHTSPICLILTGGRTPLGYVTERAESEGVPILITAKDTPSAVRALEGLYAGGRFGGGPKAERIAQLIAERLDDAALRKVLASGQK
jgi:BioD-like phosphotransacetylase family protein